MFFINNTNLINNKYTLASRDFLDILCFILINCELYTYNSNNNIIQNQNLHYTMIHCIVFIIVYLFIVIIICYRNPNNVNHIAETGINKNVQINKEFPIG